MIPIHQIIIDAFTAIAPTRKAGISASVDRYTIAYQIIS
jgi:hypothetical protein